MVRGIVSNLKEKGVNEIVVGYPKGIVRNRGNKLTVNFWSYGYTIRRFNEIGEELGIKVTTVDEAYTSKTCSLCGEVHENGRVKRGLFVCPHIGKAINADLNGATNILHIPKSQRSGNVVTHGGIGVIGLKTQPVVYHWTNGAGWMQKAFTSYEAMKMKVVNHKPMNHPKGTLALQGGEVSVQPKISDAGEMKDA